MKKNLFFLVAASVALASCSNEEVVDFNTDDAICFRAAVSHNSISRGEETVNGEFNEFYVTAIEDTTPDDETDNNYTELFHDLLFKKTGANGEFISDPVYKWSNKLSLKFFAYGYQAQNGMGKPNVEGSVFGEEVYITPEQATINGFSPQPEIIDQIDLVTAVAQSKKTALNASVSLNFVHVLSEVQVKAKCDTKAYQIMVKAMKLGNIDNLGQYDFHTNSWTITKNNKTSYNVSTRADGKPLELVDEELDLSRVDDLGYAMLLPQTLTTFGSSEGFWDVAKPGKTQASAQYIAVLIKILARNAETGEPMADAVKFPLNPDHYADEENYGWAYIPIHVDKCPDWQKGFRYIYHLDFSNGAGYNEDGEQILPSNIQFTADVKEWSVVDVYKPSGNVSGR